MTTITREEVKAFIEQIESDLSNGWEAQIFELKLARIALASLEAEPIGAFHIADQQVGGTSDYIKDGEWPIDNGIIEVYAAPPATVVPEKLPCSVELKPGLIIGKGCKTETLLTALRRRADYYAKIDAFTSEERAEHDASIEAFKAMLPTPADSQGRPRAPVVPPAIEPDYKVIKSILPTANPDEYACCIAADMWNACRAAMLQDNQRDLSQPVDPQVAEYEQIMLQAGWVMVPKTVTPEISLAINKVGQQCTCGNCSQRLWDMLIAAAPQPQNAQQNITENIHAGKSTATPDCWISCSERMPEQGAYISAVSKHGEYVAGQVIDDWLDLHDGTSFGLDEVYLWMMLPPLPAPPQQ